MDRVVCLVCDTHKVTPPRREYSPEVDKIEWDFGDIRGGKREGRKGRGKKQKEKESDFSHSSCNKNIKNMQSPNIYMFINPNMFFDYLIKEQYTVPNVLNVCIHSV